MALPGSNLAIGLNSGLLATKLAYAMYVILLRPQVSLTAYVVEVVCAGLETALCVCLVDLQFFVDVNGVQNAMLYLEISLLALRVGCLPVLVAPEK